MYKQSLKPLMILLKLLSIGLLTLLFWVVSSFMRVSNFLQNPKIVCRKKAACDCNQAAGYDGSDLCSDAPDTLLRSVDVDNCCQKTGDCI